MKKSIKTIIPIFALSLIALCSITAYMIVQVQSYSKLVNYVGIVRGATQRLVKLELNGVPSDELKAYLDNILEELVAGEGDVGLVLIDDEVYRGNLNKLYGMWSEVKDEIGLCVRVLRRMNFLH